MSVNLSYNTYFKRLSITRDQLTIFTAINMLKSHAYKQTNFTIRHLETKPLTLCRNNKNHNLSITSLLRCMSILVSQAIQVSNTLKTLL